MPHPDYGNQSKPVWIDADRVTYMERSFTGWIKEGVQEEHRQALQVLHDEVRRVGYQLRLMTNFDDERAAHITVELRDNYAALSAAAGAINHVVTKPQYHERAECTTIGIDCGYQTIVHVLETPDEVTEIIKTEKKEKNDVR
jgi:hypothetical protein